jgi:hypothetical protein
MLAIFTSSEPEAFFDDLSAATAGTEGPPDPGRLLPVLAKHHVELLGLTP